MNEASTKTVHLKIVRGRKGRISKWFVDVHEPGMVTTLGPEDSKAKAVKVAERWVRENQVDGRRALIKVPNA